MKLQQVNETSQSAQPLHITSTTIRNALYFRVFIFKGRRGDLFLPILLLVATASHLFVESRLQVMIVFNLIYAGCALGT